MNIVATLNKNVAFFYWLQTVSKWDKSYAFEYPLFTYYRHVIQPADEPILSQVRAIIQSDSNPYDILRKLYSENLITKTSVSLLIFLLLLWIDLIVFGKIVMKTLVCGVML